MDDMEISNNESENNIRGQLEESRSPARTNTPQSIVQSSTPTLQPIKTFVPTPLPTATLFSTKTPMTIPTLVSSVTPWPTLSSDLAVPQIISLLEDNQNLDCLLPCWWGAFPGQTEWNDYEPFINSFAKSLTAFPEKNVFVGIFPVPLAVNYLEELNIGFLINETGKIIEIGIASINVTGYNPQTMMELYGVPSEVWLNTIHEPREGVLPFQLIIVYQQKGISFRYRVDASKVDDIIVACFEPNYIELERPDLFPAGPRIYLWEPGQTKTIQEISPIPLEMYYPLEDKTDLTPRSLYEKFSNPNEPPCINSAAALWEP